MMTAIVAAGFAAFILIYFASNVNEKEHFILRLLLFSFGIVLLIFLGKGAIDGVEVCENVLNNTQEIYVYGNYFEGYHWDGYNGTAPSPADKNAYLFHKNITNYYSVVCYDRTNTTTGTVLYKTILYMFIVYVAYILFYFVYWMFNLTRKFWKRR